MPRIPGISRALHRAGFPECTPFASRSRTATVIDATGSNFSSMLDPLMDGLAWGTGIVRSVGTVSAWANLQVAARVTDPTNAWQQHTRLQFKPQTPSYVIVRHDLDGTEVSRSGEVRYDGTSVITLNPPDTDGFYSVTECVDSTAIAPELPFPEDNPPTAETFIYIYVDSSGSMDGEIANLRRMHMRLVELLTTEVYEGDVEKANRQVVYRELDDERWVRWFANPENYDEGEAQDNVIIFAFINESNSIYHSGTSYNYLAPAWVEDYAALLVQLEERETVRGKLYAISTSSLGAEGQVFQDMVIEAFASHMFPPSMAAETGIPSNNTALFYLNEVRSFMSLPPDDTPIGGWPLLRTITQTYEAGSFRLSNTIMCQLVSHTYAQGSNTVRGSFMRLRLVSQSQNDGTTAMRGQFVLAYTVGQEEVSPDISPMGNFILTNEYDAIQQYDEEGASAYTGRFIYLTMFYEIGQYTSNGSVTRSGKFFLPRNITQSNTTGTTSLSLRAILPFSVYQYESYGSTTARANAIQRPIRLENYYQQGTTTPTT